MQPSLSSDPGGEHTRGVGREEGQITLLYLYIIIRYNIPEREKEY